MSQPEVCTTLEQVMLRCVQDTQTPFGKHSGSEVSGECCSVTPVLYSKSWLFDGTRVISLLVRTINLGPGTGILIQSWILFWLGLIDYCSGFCFWSLSSGKTSDIPHKYRVGPTFWVSLHPWSCKHAVLHRWTPVFCLWTQRTGLFHLYALCFLF